MVDKSLQVDFSMYLVQHVSVISFIILRISLPLKGWPKAAGTHEKDHSFILCHLFQRRLAPTTTGSAGGGDGREEETACCPPSNEKNSDVETK